MSDTIKEIESLGGNVRADWHPEGHEAQLESLRNDLAARHANGEDVGAHYPNNAEAQALGTEHREQLEQIQALGGYVRAEGDHRVVVGLSKKDASHGIPATRGMIDATVAQLQSANATPRPARPKGDA